MGDPTRRPAWTAGPATYTAPPPRHVDVLVVGGGITGASVLHALRDRGVRAALVERHHLAAGASGRNAGFLLAGIAESYAAAVRSHGREVAREIWAFTAENHERLAAALRGRAGYARRGSLTAAATPEEAADLQQSAQLLAEDGFTAEWHDTLSAPLHELHGGLVNPGDGEVDPASAVRILAARAGGSIHEGVDVRGFEVRHGDIRVDTSRGHIRAHAVVLATNAWIPELAPGLPIRPVRAQMLATAPNRERIAERPVYSHWGYRYWRQLDDGRLLVGGWRDTAVDAEVGFDVTPTPPLQAHLEAHARLLGADAPVAQRWAGTMGCTDDQLPLVGAVPGQVGVWAVGGFTGHGMGFAVNTARVLVEAMFDHKPVPPWMALERVGVGSPAGAPSFSATGD